MSALQHGHLFETCKPGSGVGHCNLDMVHELTPLMQETGYDVSIEHLPERVFDVHENVLDSSGLRAHTGWQPREEFVDGLNRDWLGTQID